MRDQYTGGHTAARHRSIRCCWPSICKSRPRTCDLIRIGTPLHDIGKIGIDDAILRKPGKLTTEEFEIMKTHTAMGAEILRTGARPAADHPDRPLAPRTLGRPGLPRRPQAGEKIPRLARIVAVADAFDAMTSDRPYRKGMPAQVAFDEVKNQSGKQFDPECAKGFIDIQDRIVEEMKQAAIKAEGLAHALEAS